MAGMNGRRFHITTFGCQMNVHDSLWLKHSLELLGWRESSEDQADALILNTCSVRDKPEQKVYSHLGRLRDYWEHNPDILVAVGGCVAQQVGEAFFARFPYVRLVYGPDGLPLVPQSLDRLARESGQRISLLEFSRTFPEREAALPRPGAAAQAFVNIMQGCDNFCAYCIVPLTRGRQRSRSSMAIMDECRALVDRGVVEITLLGQNVNSYGLDAPDREPSFPELLDAIAALPGLRRLRFTTSHPKDISERTIAAFGRWPSICPHLHLPLQSGSDAVLRAMGRKYTLAKYEATVDGLRRVCPDIALSTDLIVGFPGETEHDFTCTLEAMQRIGFAGSFSFMYSDRPGTRAAQMPDKVPGAVKAARLSALQELQDRISANYLHARIGQRTMVLVEGPSKKAGLGRPCFRGRDEHGGTVNFVRPEGMSGPDQDRNLTGKIVPVRVLEAKKHSLWGCMEDL
jgi:tRNA-2-methylthio-N6-dimethylallyladenosine synthase